jgi:hypothetical protein
MSSLETLLGDALALRTAAIPYAISAALENLHPDRHVLETSEGDFDPHEYAAEQPCEIVQRQSPHGEIETGWQGTGKGLSISPTCAAFDVKWQGTSSST